MKKILILILVIVLSLIPTAPAFPADELIYETFDSWKNPFVAEGWSAVSVGGWGGEFNQIYDAAQVIEIGAGDSVYYNSIYRDFKVEPGKLYGFTFRFKGPFRAVKAWLQFDDKDGNVLETHGGSEGQGWKGFGPTVGGLYEGRFQVKEWWPTVYPLKAPAGADHTRIIFQVEAGAEKRQIYIRNVNFGEYILRGYTGVGAPDYGLWAGPGPSILRNTDWAGAAVASGWNGYKVGAARGDYGFAPVGGSSQGISCGGNSFEENKHIYRDFRVTAGVKYRLSVDVISNSTNFLGTRDPSPVRIWVQYNGPGYIQNPMGYGDTVLSTHGIDGKQAGVKMDEWTTVTVPGPNGEPYTVAPSGANRARVILQVMGGTGGGTIFDNVSFTRVD